MQKDYLIFFFLLLFQCGRKMDWLKRKEKEFCWRFFEYPNREILTHNGFSVLIPATQEDPK